MSAESKEHQYGNLAMSTENGAMTPDQAEALRLLFSDLRWPERSLGLTAGDLLLVDGDMLSALRGAGPIYKAGNLDEVLAGVHQGQPAVDLSASGRIFVLSKQQEHIKARRLSAAYPAHSIQSVTYGGVHQPPAQMTERGITIISGSFLSGLGYLTDLLRENGFCVAAPLLGEGEVVWSQIQADFNMLRALRAGAVRSAPQGSYRGRTLFYIDPLWFEQLRSDGKLHQALLRRFMRRYKVEVLYLIRRNKMAHALIAASMGKNHGFSHAASLAFLPKLSTLKKRERKALGKPEMPEVLNIAIRLIGAEAALEPAYDGAASMKMLTFEELIGNPVEIMKMLAPFLGEKRLRKVRIPDFRDEIFTASWFDAALVESRQLLISELGLVYSEHGSLTTPLLRMLNPEARLSQQTQDSDETDTDF